MEDLKHGAWERDSRQHGNDIDGFWTERFLKCYYRRDAFIPKHKPPYCEECGSKMDGDTKNE